MSKLEEMLNSIEPVDQEAMAQAQRWLDSLTKPLGSLGVLEDIARQLAGIKGCAGPPLIQKKTSILMAADHGVVAEGVSAYPQAVTAQMVLNFAQGGAGMNVLARHVGAELIIVDIGVAADLPDIPGLLHRKVAWGTANIATGPAMTPQQAWQAVEVGIEVAAACIDRGTDLLGIGEMGIGNTTPSSAIIAAYSGLPVADLVGGGSGIDGERRQKKIAVIEKALAANQPDLTDPLDVLAKLGGLEIAGMLGVILAGAAHRVPVVIDGFISGAAALVAVRLQPAIRDYLIASHLSEEPGHRVMLELVGLRPMLYMKMRLGEGTGAALAMPIVEAALKIMHEMATFDDAGISGVL